MHLPANTLSIGTVLYPPRGFNGVQAGHVIYAMGRFREAAIVKIGPKRTTVSYVAETTGREFTKAVPHAEVWHLEPQFKGQDPAGVIAGPPPVPRHYRSRGGGHRLVPVEDA